MSQPGQQWQGMKGVLMAGWGSWTLCENHCIALPCWTCANLQFVIGACGPALLLQAGLVKAPPPEVAAPPSLVERHADRMKKSGFIIPQEVRPR